MDINNITTIVNNDGKEILSVTSTNNSSEQAAVFFRENTFQNCTFNYNKLNIIIKNDELLTLVCSKFPFLECSVKMSFQFVTSAKMSFHVTQVLNQTTFGIQKMLKRLSIFNN